MSTIDEQGFEQKREEIRLYVLARDRGKCQWPGCTTNTSVEVLFLVHTDPNIRKIEQFDNGITVCKKHKEIVFLDEVLFAPFLADLVKLVEFEREIETIEDHIKAIVQKRLGN